MLHGLSEQIVHCQVCAAECMEFAARAVSPSDRDIYLERAQAWLTLARRYELSERLGRMVKELQRQAWGWPQAETVTLPDCPACGIQMRLLVEQPTLVQPTTIFEHAFLQCPNCCRLSEHFAAVPRD